MLAQALVLARRVRVRHCQYNGGAKRDGRTEFRAACRAAPSALQSGAERFNVRAFLHPLMRRCRGLFPLFPMPPR